MIYQPTLAQTRMSLPLICPDYDEDCLNMAYGEAVECFEGFPDNPHAQAYMPGLGRADGVCPIIARLVN